jgi:hypothetical protein
MIRLVEEVLEHWSFACWRGLADGRRDFWRVNADPYFCSRIAEGAD